MMVGRRLGAATAALAATLFGAHAAEARDFGRKGDVSIAVDRVFGLYFMELEQDDRRGGESDANLTELGLGWGAPGITPYTIPRFAIDFFVIDQLSIGGSIAFANVGDDGDLTTLLIHPRGGYFIPFSATFGFWPRGGLTYHSFSNGVEEDGLALTAEGMFAVTPVDHFGFLFGPLFDFSLTGERNDLDRRYRVFGITGGLFGWI